MPLRSYDDREAARGRLRQAMHDWLTAAPVYQVRTNAGKVDPADPAYSTTPMSVLTVRDAVEDLGHAVNKYPRQNRCPDRLLRVLGRRLGWEFETLSFVDVSPTLPDRYSDVLIRHTERWRYQHMKPEVDSDIGSIYRSPGGDVVVLWRLSGRDHPRP